METYGVMSSRQTIKTIFTLAIPAVIENFFQTILGFVDTYFVSKIGLVEVSAVGITNAILAVYFAVFMSIGVSANVFIAKYIGAGQMEKAQKLSNQSIVLSIVIGLIFGLVTLLFAEPLLKLMGVSTDVLEQGKTYFQIVAVPSILISLMFVLSSLLRGTGDTKSPMKVSIFINLINIILDYVFIFGLWMIPSMGLVGAALATVIARLLGVIALFIYLDKSCLKGFLRKSWKLDLSIQKELIALGSPAAAERLAMRIGRVLYFGFIVKLGTDTFASHQIAGNIEVFSYMIGYGFATAATILVSQQLGANNLELAKKYAKISVYMGVGCMTVFGAFLYIFGGWIATFFTKEQVVIEQITVALQIDAFIQPILAVVLILTGVYQGGQNTKFPFYITTIGIWIIRTVGVYLLGITMGLGIAGVWIAIGLDNLFRAIWLWKRFKNGKWMSTYYKKINV